MTPHFSEDKWLGWIDELSVHDYVVIDDFLSNQVFREIQSFYESKYGEFKQAGIGTLDNHMIAKNIRSDRTFWLDSKRDYEIGAFWSLLDETMLALNRYCFLNLSGFEFHLAHYSQGGHYDRHVDQFQGQKNRMISIVIYLNENWHQGDGGELEIFERDTPILVAPIARRCVIFKSADISHAVRISIKSRNSVTGWLLYIP